MSESLVPDLIEAVLGYRTWAIDADGWLMPFSLATISGPWRPGVNHARCHYAKWQRGASGPEPAPPHPAPHARCMCGLYALLDPRDQRLPWNDATLAVGAVGAWGELELHRAGFRAEYATVLALAVPRRTAPHLLARHEKAAARYGVELVAPDLLEAFGRRHAAPVPASLLPSRRPEVPNRRAAAPRPAANPPAPVRGLRPEEHVWFDVPEFRCGITGALAGQLGPGPIDLTLPAEGTRHRTSDALAHVTPVDGETLRIWPPLGGTVLEVNPALADDPGLLLRDPEGAGWLARLDPSDWNGEAGGIEWGAQAARAYRVVLQEPDPWSQLRATTLRVHSAEAVLAELRRRRALPRFADAAAVHEGLVEPLAVALGAAPSAARALARLRLRVGFLVSDPSTAFTLDATGPAAVLELHPARAPDVTLSLDAVVLEQLLTRRLDLARAVRSGTIRADLETRRTLGILSVLRHLPVLTRPVPSQGSLST